jgi:hypothetical protein
MMYPAHDGGVSHRQAAFDHHLHQVSEAELEAQAPPHAQDDYLAIKVPTVKQFIQTREPGHHTASTHQMAGRVERPVDCTRALNRMTTFGVPATVRIR